jgi:sec-independent protein translocase protein TatB
VALLVFGPDKMPEIGRQVARGVREFRRVQQHVSSELRGVVSELDLGPDDPPAGGDPVPTLPPKPAPPTPDTVEPTADVDSPATNGHTPPAAGSPAFPGDPGTSPPAEPA